MLEIVDVDPVRDALVARQQGGTALLRWFYGPGDTFSDTCPGGGEITSAQRFEDRLQAEFEDDTGVVVTQVDYEGDPGLASAWRVGCGT